MEAPLQTEMVELVPNGKHSEGLLPVTTPTAGNPRVEGPRRSCVEGKGFLQKNPSKEPHFTDFEGKTSFGMSVFNLSNAIMGSGILGLAYAMANTGIILFLFLLTAVALLSSYSIHLLLKSSGIVGIRAYEQLGYRAFGTPGKLAAALAITLQNIGAMSSYLYIIKSELPLVIQTFLNLEEQTSDWYMNGNYLVILVSVTVILPLALMRQLGYLGYSSGFSLSCMVFFLIAVIYKKFHVPCPLPVNFANITGNFSLVEVTKEEAQLRVETETTALCTPSYFTLNSQVPTGQGGGGGPRESGGGCPDVVPVSPQTAYTIPIMAFAFVCHPEVLPIYTELKDPSKRKMQHISNLSISVMYVMYFLAALFGYLTFYDGVESELLHTYSKVDPFDVLILCVRVAVLTAVTLTVPIVLFPVRRAIQQMLFKNQEFSWLRHTLIAIGLLTCINLLVIFAPNILGIFGVIGATSAPCLIFIFPAIFYFRIIPTEREPAKSTPKILVRGSWRPFVSLCLASC
ncbi:sodium-coupled neutral amino acid transporter 3 isoform X2 [Mirounga angustirostris]|uniref:sodium-coupled neutral amino acid transporter 3 isoform X2 n=1 Tax=Mirounga angustirostris TaxID=9716 RepID=UPI001E68E6A3|nr:sodium-coupled neutral amino acid transporter 3 isoform X2 [Mirounga angustirostris]